MNPALKAKIVVGLNAVIAAVTQETPRILTVRSGERSSAGWDGLPYGPLDPASDRTLELALRRWVLDQTGIELGYVEQLYTFGDQNRDPRFFSGRARNISVAYLALVQEVIPPGKMAGWKDWYAFLPWEDWRDGRPTTIEQEILPSLQGWIQEAGTVSLRRQRRERVDLAFGSGGVTWNWERTLDRYELLYEACLVEEAVRDRDARSEPGAPSHPVWLSGRGSDSRLFGQGMILDHRRILATALDRIRGKLRYRPVVFELLPPAFTLFQLQRLVESLAGFRLHKQNFRRLVETSGLVEKTGMVFHRTGGRPAELFAFRREVLRERPAPGVGLPVVH